MQLDLDLVTKYLKCKPWREIVDTTISSPDQILNHWLPPIVPDIVKEDLLEFFTNKISGKLGWLRSCTNSSFTKFKVSFEPGGYRGLPDFIDWDGKLDGQFLEHLLPLLQSIAECTITPLTVEQFWLLATELCKFTNFPLSSLDIRIIKTFSQMPMITIPALARLLGISYKKARSRWNRLRRLNICRIPAQVNYRILGLTPIFIELHDLTTMIKSPYILAYNELSGNSKNRLYFMVVPEGQLSQLSKFLDSQFGVTHTLYLAEDMGQTIEFTHYQINTGSWNVDWRTLFIGAHLFHSNSRNPTQLVPSEKNQQPLRLYSPDARDTRIIPVLASDARIKLEKLAKIAEMSISQASRRKTKLIDLGVLQPKPIIRRIGLLEDVVIRMKENDTRLLGIIKELPQAWIRRLTEYHTGNREIFVYATLPAGSYAQIRYYLSKYLHTKSDIFISGPENGGWPLTFDTFNIEQCRWIWQEPIIVEPHKMTAFKMKSQQRHTSEAELEGGEPRQ